MTASLNIAGRRVPVDSPEQQSSLIESRSGETNVAAVSITEITGQSHIVDQWSLYYSISTYELGETRSPVGTEGASLSSGSLLLPPPELGIPTFSWVR